MSGINSLNFGINGYGNYSYDYAVGSSGESIKTDAQKAIEESKGIDTPMEKATGKAECQTCKERKYVDGSDEMVSFKSPAKISPESAMSRVMAHEQEHVSNAFAKAAQGNGKVLQASVTLKTAICPECGRSYIAGGTTSTKISYPKDPYSQNRKSMDRPATIGGNVDQAV